MLVQVGKDERSDLQWRGRVLSDALVLYRLTIREQRNTVRKYSLTRVHRPRREIHTTRRRRSDPVPVVTARVRCGAAHIRKATRTSE